MDKVKLNDVARFINGYAFKPSDWHGEGRKIIRIQNLTNGLKEFNRTNTNISEKYRVKNGDVLVSWSATLDVFEWQDKEDAWVNQHIFKIDHDRKLVEKYYLKYALKQTLFELGRYSHGSTMKHVVRSDFLNHKIPLVSLSEQKQIVQTLDTADTLRQKRKEQLNLLDDYLKSVFFEMFGDPYFNSKGWDTKKMKNVCDFITKGTTPKKHDICEQRNNDSIPFLKVYHIMDDGSINFHYKPSFVDKKLHCEYLKRSKVYPRDILMNIVGPPLGKIGIVPSNYLEWNVNQALAIFRCKKQVSPYYLLFMLKSNNFCDSIIQLAVGIRQQNLSLEQCRNIEIPVPSINSQNKFASIVEQVEQTKQRMRASLNEMDNHFNALMQRYFG